MKTRHPAQDSVRRACVLFLALVLTLLDPHQVDAARVVRARVAFRGRAGVRARVAVRGRFGVRRFGFRGFGVRRFGVRRPGFGVAVRRFRVAAAGPAAVPGPGLAPAAPDDAAAQPPPPPPPPPQAPNRPLAQEARRVNLRP